MPRSRDASTRLYRDACSYMPGGVNSPVRAFSAVGGEPLFIARGKGAHLTDVDGNEYVDWVGSWGPLVLGHAYPPVVEAVTRAARKGTSFGAPTASETELARRICEAVPSVERVRMVNSGTEATASALRLARGATGRDRVVKMEGCYHGHVDDLLVAAGSGATTFGQPSSPGVPAAAAELTLVVPFNDLEALADAIAGREDEVAAVILEPVAGNMGVVPPAVGYLEGIRELCDRHGILLIFDEVMTGFRVARGGAQARFEVTPDLTCLGKIIGGGLPVGAYGGRADLMEEMSPTGPIYQAGTLSGNPLAMTAGVAQLDALAAEGCYERLEELGGRLESGLRKAIDGTRCPAHVGRIGSMLTLFFHAGPVRSYAEASTCDTEAFGSFHRGMLDRGFYLPASQFEAWFVSLAHGEEEVDRTVEAAAEVLREI